MFLLQRNASRANHTQQSPGAIRISCQGCTCNKTRKLKIIMCTCVLGRLQTGLQNNKVVYMFANACIGHCQANLWTSSKYNSPKLLNSINFLFYQGHSGRTCFIVTVPCTCVYVDGAINAYPANRSCIDHQVCCLFECEACHVACHSCMEI